MQLVYDVNRGVYRFGALDRNHHGNVVVAMHGHYPPLLSPLCVEAWAVLEGLGLADRMEILEVTLLFDSLGLISMLNGLTNGDVEVHALL